MSNFASQARGVDVSYPFPPRPYDRAEDGKRQLVRICEQADMQIAELERDQRSLKCSQTEKIAELDAEITHRNALIRKLRDILAEAGLMIPELLHEIETTLP